MIDDPAELLVGESPALRTAMELVSRAAATSASVLITGETGTGKELAAKALHSLSDLREGPLLAVNCSAVPATLLEGQFFGHVRGSFTGAVADHAGFLVRADGGTLVLDEIGDMPFELQPKLLRAVEERRVLPLGGSTEIPFSTRIVATTNQSIEESVACGRFRTDLLMRLAVIRIRMPPLRERGDDIVLLARHFLARFGCGMRPGAPSCTLGPSAIDALRAHTWPGNVRELRNVIEGAVVSAAGPILLAEDVMRGMFTSLTPPAGDGHSSPSTLRDATREHIDAALAKVGGNRSAAARLLGIDRRTVQRHVARRGRPTE